MATKQEDQRTIGEGLSSLGRFLLSPARGFGEAVGAVQTGQPTGFQGVNFAPLAQGVRQALLGSPLSPALGELDQKFAALNKPVTAPAPAKPPLDASTLKPMQPLVTPSGQPETYPGQAATEARLSAFDQTQAAPAATPAAAVTTLNNDLTNALMRTALGQQQQQGNGINFGATGTTPAPVANPFAAQFGDLLNRVTAMANTAPSGSDSFVDFFQKAATRKRGQEALANLASLAGQANTAQMQAQAQQQNVQAQLGQQAQEAQQRNALLAGQTLLQSQTSLAEKNAALESAKAKASAEAPKLAAETAKAQAEAQKQQLVNNLNQNIAAQIAQGKPVPQELLNLGQYFAIGQAVQPPKVEFKTVTDPISGKPTVIAANPVTGTLLSAGAPSQLLEQQNVGTVAPGTAVPSQAEAGKVYFTNPTTKNTVLGTPEQFYAAYPTAKK